MAEGKQKIGWIGIGRMGSPMAEGLPAAGRDVEEVLFGGGGVAAGGRDRLPKIFVDCSTIGVEESTTIRRRLAERGVDFVAAPVSGNAKCVRAGKLSAVVSGPAGACRAARPL